MSIKIVDEINLLLGFLSAKEQIVIQKRFGLQEMGEIGTLANIGLEYGITRERIRQIQENALKKLKRHAMNSVLNDFISWFEFELEALGGLVSESELNVILTKKFNCVSAVELNYVKLACALSDKVKWEHNKVNYESHFRWASIGFNQIANVCCSVIEALSANNQEMSESALYSSVVRNHPCLNKSQKLFSSIIKINRLISVSNKGVSLFAWRHVNPKTLFDKILFVLTDTREPLHFSEIAKKIESYQFDTKTVSTQAVHNELINNPIFVLIGRGIYALKTWGYKEGTVSDVLESILSKSGPMHLYDLTKEVLQRRKVKPVTVQINLNNKKSKFRKTKDGMFELAN